MACIACHKSDQIHSWQMDNREWQIFIDTVTILPPRLYPWYLISHQRMILALFLALRQRQSQNLHGSRRHKSRLCEHKKERQNTKEQDSKPARRVRVLYCPPYKNPETATVSPHRYTMCHGGYSRYGQKQDANSNAWVCVLLFYIRIELDRSNVDGRSFVTVKSPRA